MLFGRLVPGSATRSYLNAWNLSLSIGGLISLLKRSLFHQSCTYESYSTMSKSRLKAVALDIFLCSGASKHEVTQSIFLSLIAQVLGYMCLFLYGSTAIVGYRKWRGVGQFRRYRFQNQTPPRREARASRNSRSMSRSNSRTPVS